MSSCEEILIQNARLFLALRENRPKKEKEKKVTKCLNKGANVNERFRGDDDNTPLHIAVIKEDKDIVILLLCRGADTDIKNNDDKTPLDLAKELNTVTGKHIVNILESQNKKTQINEKTDNIEELYSSEFILTKNDSVTTKYMFKKRSGVKDIKGELYETKLLSLIYVRAILNKTLDYFYFGSSMEEIGALDDICLRYKQKDRDNAIFIQAKHKTNITNCKITLNDLWSHNGDFSLPKYFSSYLKIKQKFNVTNEDEMFRGRFEDVKCYFILYTTIKGDFDHREYSNMYKMNETIKELIYSSENCNNNILQYKYNERDIETLTKTVQIERMKLLGKILFRFVQNGNYHLMMSDELIRKFHVALAQNVIKVTEEINEDGYRTGSIRPEFLTSNDEILLALKTVLYTETLREKKNCENIDSCLLSISYEPTAENISKLIGNVLFYNDKTNKLEIRDNEIKNQSKFYAYLSTLKVTQSIINEAIEIAGVKQLTSGNWKKIKLPILFGNLNMVMNEKKADKRIKHLADKITELISESTSKTIVIDSNCLLEPNILNISGGIGSAVGNLLVLDENKLLKFNVYEESLDKYAHKLINMLKENVKDLDSFRFQINIDSFPTLTFDTNESEAKVAKDFLNNLWFYTCQATENDIEIHCKRTIEDFYKRSNQNSYKIISYNYAEAIFLKVHSEIQKWWMLHYKTYLTNESEYFHNFLNKFADKSLAGVLNFIFYNEIKNYEIECNENAVNNLRLDELKLGWTAIVTENSLLTSIKLVQYFDDINDHMFLNLDYILLHSARECQMLFNDIYKLKFKTIIIFCKSISQSNIDMLLGNCNTSIETKFIVVTKENSIPILKQHFPHNNFVVVKDENNNFTDLTPESQNIILRVPFIYQGLEVKFNVVFDKESTYIINTHILRKMIKKEIINVGKSLLNSNYKDIKCYYIHRSVCCDNSSTPTATYFTEDETDYSPSFSTEEDSYSSDDSLKVVPCASSLIVKKKIKMKSLEDLKDTVIILGAPGMGKSTLLSHLSITTKMLKPNIWIERINLLDYTKEFHCWKKNKIKIGKLDALKFVCNAALSKYRTKIIVQNNDENDFDLEIKNGVLKLRNCKIKDVVVLFELELFIYSYNKGDTYLLFDGFDEICPHYKVEITDLLKCLEIQSNCGIERKQNLWITSRSYNNIRKTLEQKFGNSYTLKEFSENDKTIFLENYFEMHFNIKDFTVDQFQNIDSLFEYMKQFELYNHPRNGRKCIKLTSLLLHSIYAAAVAYIQRKIKQIPLTPDKQIFRNKFGQIKKAYFITDKLLAGGRDINKVINMTKTPLHLYIAVDYFLNKIKDTSYSKSRHLSNMWDLDVNTFTFYKSFFETKLKKIRFEEKGGMNIYNPDMKIVYDREYKEFVDKHKKLAFYALFLNDIEKFLPQMEIKNIEDTIQRMEEGEEKTGVIEYILNGVPKFVHLSFAEYFAVEFLSDLLKTTTQEEQKNLWSFIINDILFGGLIGFMSVLDHKFKIDSELMHSITSTALKEMIFKEISSQTINPYSAEVWIDYPGDPSVFTETALDKAVGYGLRHIAKVLLSAVTSVVNNGNLNKFLYLITDCKFFPNAIALGFDDILEIVLDCIRKVDSSMLHKIYAGRWYCKFTKFDCSNEDIINDLKSKHNEINY